MKKISFFIIGLMFVFTIAIPFTNVSAATATTTKTGLVPVCNTIIDKINGGFTNPCDFNYFMILLNSIINFLLFVIATPLAAMIICYAGWLYLSSGGSSENISKAKKILLNLVIGYVIALAALLIVKTILKTLGIDPSIETFLK